MQTAVIIACLVMGAPSGPDTLVVCPPIYEKALAPWLEHRAAQGHRVATLSEVSSADLIRQGIRATAKSGALKNVLIVGDAPPLDAPKGFTSPALVPTHYEPARIIQRYGSEKEIATDNWYADLNDDGVPDLAIGRLPVNNPWQLSAVVRKILAYEKSTDQGPWRRKVNLVAGVGGFGVVADTVIETAARRLITDGIPPAFETTMTQANWHSPYCPAPCKFNETTIERLNEGCLFFVYLGHGFPYRCATIESPDGEFPILSCANVPQLRCRHAAPVAVFMACYNCGFDASKGCLGEELLLAEGGPVAVIGGTRTTMPYGMSVLSLTLLDECFVKQRATLGEIVLNAKRRSVLEEPQTSLRKIVDGVASVISPEGNRMADERLEHAQIIQLLGDPLLRIRAPRPLTLAVKDSVDAGETLEVGGETPLAGKCIVQIACRRDRLTFAPPARRKYDASASGLASFAETYERANDTRWCEKQIQLPSGPFRVQLPLPHEARGPCYVRVFVEGTTDFACGAADVYIREPRTARKE